MVFLPTVVGCAARRCSILEFRMHCFSTWGGGRFDPVHLPIRSIDIRAHAIGTWNFQAGLIRYSLISVLLTSKGCWHRNYNSLKFQLTSVTTEKVSFNSMKIGSLWKFDLFAVTQAFFDLVASKTRWCSYEVTHLERMFKFCFYLSWKKVWNLVVRMKLWFELEIKFSKWKRFYNIKSISNPTGS